MFSPDISGTNRVYSDSMSGQIQGHTLGHCCYSGFACLICPAGMVRHNMVGLDTTYVHHSTVPGVCYGIKTNNKIYSKELHECWTAWRFEKRQRRLYVASQQLTKLQWMYLTIWMSQLLNASPGARFDPFFFFFLRIWLQLCILFFQFLHLLIFVLLYIACISWKDMSRKTPEKLSSSVRVEIQLASNF